MYYTKGQILEKIRSYCAYQERCQWEVSRKLYELGADKETADEIIASLVKDQFLNEERFAITAAHGKWKMQSWGKIKIKQWLVARGISLNLIATALNAINQEEYLDGLKKLSLKQFEKVKGSVMEKLKISQKLKNKGYEPELIRECLEQLPWIQDEP